MIKRVTGSGRFGVVVAWKDNSTDTDWFETAELRDKFHKMTKTLKQVKSVRRIDR